MAAYRFWLSLMECSLGRVLSDKRQLPDAQAHLVSAIDRLEPYEDDPHLGGLRPFLSMAYRDLAEVYTRSGKPQLAAEALGKAEKLGRGPLQVPASSTPPGGPPPPRPRA